MFNCYAFAQPVRFPGPNPKNNNIFAVNEICMQACYNLTEIDFAACDGSEFTDLPLYIERSFSCHSDSPAYINGVTIKGEHKQALLNKYPNSASYDFARRWII
ncbi:MAG: hypothetical protein LBQ47_08990 [Endomicrobium sp.]|jgi:hypothetical protein|nr:hypothetical protein [Endomicrobium sp.]